MSPLLGTQPVLKRQLTPVLFLIRLNQETHELEGWSISVTSTELGPGGGGELGVHPVLGKSGRSRQLVDSSADGANAIITGLAISANTTLLCCKSRFRKAAQWGEFLMQSERDGLRRGAEH